DLHADVQTRSLADLKNEISKDDRSESRTLRRYAVTAGNEVHGGVAARLIARQHNAGIGSLVHDDDFHARHRRARFIGDIAHDRRAFYLRGQEGGKAREKRGQSQHGNPSSNGPNSSIFVKRSDEWPRALEWILLQRGLAD